MIDDDSEENDNYDENHGNDDGIDNHVMNFHDGIDNNTNYGDMMISTAEITSTLPGSILMTRSDVGSEI